MSHLATLFADKIPQATKKCDRVCSAGGASSRSCHLVPTFITANNLGSGGGRREEAVRGEPIFLGTAVAEGRRDARSERRKTFVEQRCARRATGGSGGFRNEE